MDPGSAITKSRHPDERVLIYLEGLNTVSADGSMTHDETGDGDHDDVVDVMTVTSQYDDEQRADLTDHDVMPDDLDSMDDSDVSSQLIDDKSNDLFSPVEDIIESNLSVETYKKQCKKLDIVPASCFMRQLAGRELILRHRGLDLKDVQACVAALSVNNTVEVLNLTGNNIGPVGAEYIAEMIKDNIFITELTLAQNELGSEGAQVIAEVMRENETIRKLDLSDNGFTERDAVHIAEIIRENISIRELNVSHNLFREKGGELLSAAIVANFTLEALDLSWNHLRLNGAVAIAKGLQRNKTLRKVNLAWNGFHMDGCQGMAATLQKNSTLEELDLTCNRIDHQCVKELVKGLRKNCSLITLKLSRNPISSEGAVLLLEALEQNPCIPLCELDITSQTVSYEFMTQLEALREKHPKLLIRYGIQHRQVSKTACDTTLLPLRDDPLLVLMEFMRLKTLRLIDLFSSLDKDNSHTLTRQEIKSGLMEANVPLVDEALDRLLDDLDSNNDGEIDYRELIAGQKEHRRQVASIIKESKQLDIPFEQTKIGRISTKLQAFLSAKTQNNATRAKQIVKTEDNSLPVDDTTKSDDKNKSTGKKKDKNTTKQKLVKEKKKKKTTSGSGKNVGVKTSRKKSSRAR